MWRMQILLSLCLLGTAKVTGAPPAFEHVASIHLGSRYQKIVESNGYWYLTSEWGLECWHFNTLNEFVKLSEAATPGMAQWVALEGDYAYIADGYRGISVVDVSDPFELRLLSNYSPPPMIWIEKPCQVWHVTAHDQKVYATGAFGLSVIDAADPLNLYEIGRYTLVDTIWGIPSDEGTDFGSTVFLNGKLYAPLLSTPNASKFTNGLYQFDVSDPTNPVVEHIYIPDISVPKLTLLKDSVLFVASDYDVYAFTIQPDGWLTQRGSYEDLIWHTGDSEDLAVCGKSLFIVGTGSTIQGGIANFDFSDLDTLILRQDFRWPANFNCAAIVDSVGLAGYFHADLLQMRLNDSGLLDSTGFIETYANIRGVAVKDNALYATGRGQGLFVFDIADRANPVLSQFLPQGDPGEPVLLGNYLCIGDIEPLASIYDVSNSLTPQFVAQIQRPKVSSFAKMDNVLFAAQQESLLVFTLAENTLCYVKSCAPFGQLGLQIRDSLLYTAGAVAMIEPDSTITTLSLIGNGLVDFDLMGNQYLGARGNYGLHIFDIGNPSQPIFLEYWDRWGENSPPGDASGVRVLDSYTLLFEGDFDISVIDVSDPHVPLLTTTVLTPGYALKGVLDTQYLYVADQYGVEIFRHSPEISVIDDPPVLPYDFALKQNHPNPFHSKTTIDFTIGRSSEAEIRIYNILGQRIRRITLGYRDAGSYQTTWDGCDSQGKEVANGVYYYELITNVSREHRKMIYLKR